MQTVLHHFFFFSVMMAVQFVVVFIYPETCEISLEDMESNLQPA